MGSGSKQVADSLSGLMQACYNLCAKLDTMLNEIVAVPFETDPRSFVLVRDTPRASE